MTGSSRSRKRARLLPLALATAALSSSILGASVTGTLSAFTASITNSSNTASSGSLVMKETDSSGSATSTGGCLSSASPDNAYTTCTAFNKYGGTANQLTPGGTPNTTTIRIFNTGTTAANGFVLTPGTCSKSGSTTGDACGQLKLTLTCQQLTAAGATTGSPVTLYNALSLNAIATNGPKDVLAASSTCVPTVNGATGVQFVFSVQLDSGADNTVQGQTATQQLTWKFTGA